MVLTGSSPQLPVGSSPQRSPKSDAMKIRRSAGRLASVMHFFRLSIKLSHPEGRCNHQWQTEEEGPKARDAKRQTVIRNTRVRSTLMHTWNS
jgi:hypothetical protein